MKASIKNSILIQLLLLIVIIILIPLLFFGGAAYSSYKQEIETKLITMNQDSLFQVDQNLSKMTDQINFMINRYDNDPDTEQYLTQTYESAYDKLKSTTTFEQQILDHVTSLHDINCDIILLGSNNNIFTTSYNSPMISTGSIRSSYWYEKLLEEKGSVHWFIFSRSYFSSDFNMPVIVAAKSLYNRRNDSYYGTIIIEIKEEDFFHVYQSTVDEGEILMVRNAEGNILTTSDRSVSPSLDPMDCALPIEDSHIIRNFSYNDKNYLYLDYQSSINDWHITKLIETQKMNLEIDRLQSKFFLITFCCILLIVLGIFITAIRLMNPIKNLSAKIQQQIVIPATPKKSDFRNPFPNILTGYEQLIDEVDTTVDRLIFENEARRKAELHALEMQINPHFLYNTLNSIKCLVWTGQQELIEPTITALVKLLQQTLRKTDELITLEEELDNVKNYVYIQNIRTDQSITVHYEIRPTFYSVRIPSLVLQPIVENAIFHGIEPMGRPGTLTISAYCEDLDLLIEVLDNGVGMPQETLKNLLQQDFVNKSGFNHIGIANVNERLKLHYGENYGVRIESKVNLGTSITLKIKLHN